MAMGSNVRHTNNDNFLITLFLQFLPAEQLLVPARSTNLTEKFSFYSKSAEKTCRRGALPHFSSLCLGKRSRVVDQQGHLFSQLCQEGELSQSGWVSIATTQRRYETILRYRRVKRNDVLMTHHNPVTGYGSLRTSPLKCDSTS